jgi:hypothetical protein
MRAKLEFQRYWKIYGGEKRKFQKFMSLFLDLSIQSMCEVRKNAHFLKYL